MKIPLTPSFTVITCKEGEKFIFIFAAITILLGLISSVLFTIGIFATAFCVAFFRDPEKVIPEEKGVIVSAGDGKVTGIQKVIVPSEIKSLAGQEMIKISVFLSVFNIRVNRVPTNGEVKEVTYIAGKFVSAALEKSSTENERCTIVISNSDQDLIGCTQIAGLIAKRIVCDAKVGDKFNLGDRYGLIRFGSRMDVLLPLNYEANVKVGQTVIGGETVLARRK
jgi:phosphatidylserine decarboxylase